MSDKMYDPNLGDTLPNWDMPAGPYKCTESAPALPVDGSNPSYSSNADLPDQGDIRKFDGPGSSNSNPTPAMPGAAGNGGAPMNPGLRPKGQMYDGEAL